MKLHLERLTAGDRPRAEPCRYDRMVLPVMVPNANGGDRGLRGSSTATSTWWRTVSMRPLTYLLCAGCAPNAAVISITLREKTL
jgi:hypothetical protein